MKAIVLVGGEGTRLRPLTYDLPKPMVPICGKPFMQYQLELMREHHIDEVIFSLGYKWVSFEEYFGDGSRFGMKIYYVVEDFPLGTAGAIKNVENFLDEETFLVFNGDILSEMNLSEIIAYHHNKESVCTIVLTPVDNPTIYGVVELDENCRIENFTEKPKPEEVRSNLINAGLYVLHSKILKRMEPGRKYSIEREIFPQMLREGEPMYGYHYDGYWMDIGTPFKYLSANHDLLSRKASINIGMEDGIRKGANIYLGKDVILKKPVWLGDDVIIEDGVNVIGPCVIERGCIIGEKSVINQSHIWEKTRIGARCKLDSCIIGRECKVGDGTSIGHLAVIGSWNIIEKDSTISAETRI